MKGREKRNTCNVTVGIGLGSEGSWVSGVRLGERQPRGNGDDDESGKSGARHVSRKAVVSEREKKR